MTIQPPDAPETSTEPGLVPNGVPADDAYVPMPMAAAPVVRLHDGTVGKTRNPWGVFLLCLIPFYGLVWYFMINRELRDYSDQIEVQPGLSVLAISVGWFFFFIIPLISWVRTCSRIQKAQKISGTPKRCSAILSILCLWFGMVYVQSQLNKVWDQYGNPPEGTLIAAPGHE